MIDEPASQTHKAITFLIYFRGQPGWHDRQWRMDVRTADEPALIAFVAPPIVLRAEYTRRDGVLKLFRTRVPIKRANVVFVDNVDQPGHEKVIELGVHQLRVPTDANPALWLLEQVPAIRARLVPNPQ